MVVDNPDEGKPSITVSFRTLIGRAPGRPRVPVRAADLRVRAGVDRPVRIRGASADGTLTMITCEPQCGRQRPMRGQEPRPVAGGSRCRVVDRGGPVVMARGVLAWRRTGYPGLLVTPTFVPSSATILERRPAAGTCAWSRAGEPYRGDAAPALSCRLMGGHGRPLVAVADPSLWHANATRIECRGLPDSLRVTFSAWQPVRWGGVRWRWGRR